MDMDELSTKPPDEQLVIVLHIDEAISLNAAEAVYLEATLSGNKLDTEPIKPGHTTKFGSNLIWETDRKSIKRMKLENLPVKLDCYALRNYRGDIEAATKSHIGYILVPVKNIPMVSLQKAIQLKARWSKMIGLAKEWRQHRPELLMNIMITSKDFLTYDKCDGTQTSQGNDGACSEVIEENPVPCMMSSQKGMFIRLLQQEGLLQVGSIDTDCDVFIVNILMKSFRNLDNVLNQSLEDFNQECYFNYVLLGNSHTRVLDKKFNRVHQVQEKVSIKFRSSLAALQKYFENIFFIPFEVVSEQKLLGYAELKLSDCVNTSSLHDFLEQNPSASYETEGSCILKISAELMAGIKPPFLEYKMIITYIATKKLHQSEYLESCKRQLNVDLQAGGDRREPSLKSPPRQKAKTLSDISEGQSEGASSGQNKAVGVGKSTTIPKAPVSDKVDVESILNDHVLGHSSELPRLYSYNLTLSNIKFNRRPEKGIWQISFYHDKADTQKTFINIDINNSDIKNDNSVSFDVKLKLFFTSQSKNIMDLIKSSDLCTLCVKGPRRLHGKAQLDCQNLLIGNKEKISGIVLLQDQSNNVMAICSMSTYLADFGINFNSQLKMTAIPIIQEMNPETHRSEINFRTMEDRMLMHDETFTYKIIEELEEWKGQQQESFFDDLKKKESLYLEQLKNDWVQQRAKHEEELVVKSDRLANLTNNLQKAQKNLKNKTCLNSRDECEFQKLRSEFQTSYNNQLMSIRERARRMEEDFLHEMKLKDVKFDDLERCYHHTKTENCELHQKTECLQFELGELRCNLVPKHEVEKLLQEMRLLKEKLETAQQSKIFYKEEWAKAFRECHILRREQNETSKGHLLDMKHDRFVLDCSHPELRIDQQELDEIKNCLNLSDDD